MLKVMQIPVLTDNYIYLIHEEDKNITAVIDPAEAKPVLEELKNQGWNLDYILNTHHHYDHIGGNKQLKSETGCKVVGFANDAHRITGIDIKLNDGDNFDIGNSTAKVMFVPGHTLGHIIYYFEKDKILFCGDTLFSMGCGRLFEGTYEQMYQSLNKISALPDDVEVYCAHEYTQNNAEFALTIEPDNQDLKDRYEQVKSLRKHKKPTIPTNIGLEKRTNPFLRCNLDEFVDIRGKKDNF
ncbi:hydroxyacylglutathione hydrolase [Rickettsiales bacterium]|nr:hydroxyacylglutathione hydrolase [Rickettsiales bacterium]